MLFLTERGHVVPDDLDPIETAIPLDLTGTSSRYIGQIHSEWAVRHGHLLYSVSLISSRLKMIERKRRLAMSMHRARYRDDYSSKTACDDAFSETKKAQEMDEEIMELEMQYELLQGLEGTYRAFREAASREITRRTQEQAPRD